MTQKRLLSVLIAVALVIPVAASAKTFPIGAFFPMTGSGAHIGRAMSQGALTGVEYVNKQGGIEGYKFDLIITDFKNVDVNLAVTGVRKMISVDKIPAVLACYSPTTLGTQPICEKSKVLMINGGAYSPKLVNKPFLYTIRLAQQQMVPSTLKFLWENGARSLGLIYVSDPSGILPVDDYIKPLWKQMGGKIVADEPHQTGITDLTQYYARIKSGSPDAIINYSTGESIAYGVKQAREMGMKVPIVVSDWMDNYKTIAGAASNNVYNVVDFFDRNTQDQYAQEFIKMYESKYSDKVDFFAANYFDAVMILSELIKRVSAKKGDPMDGGQLEAAIWDDPSFKSVFGGKLTLNKDGTVQKPMVIFKIVDGEQQIAKKISAN